MKTLKIRNYRQTNSTLIDNEFIDHFMAKANGEYVKVYLFLLRHFRNPDFPLTISAIADCLENTEKDILRALKYWEKQNLLVIEYDEDKKISCIDLCEVRPAFKTDTPVFAAPEPQSSIPSNPVSHTAAKMPERASEKKDRSELKSLLFIAEQYFGKTLSKTEVETITYFYDTLDFSSDLIAYLLEYCIENGHKSMHYIQKVALSWADKAITTVEQAKEASAAYNKDFYMVLNAFGIKGRSPAAPEIAYIKKWTQEYSFPTDIIVEACHRTIAGIHQPSFEYADSILKKWLEHDVKALSDIALLDSSFRQKVVKKTAAKTVVKNKFNNFEGRSYDYDSLEQQLLNSNS